MSMYGRAAQEKTDEPDRVWLWVGTGAWVKHGDRLAESLSADEAVFSTTATPCWSSWGATRRQRAPCGKTHYKGQKKVHWLKGNNLFTKTPCWRERELLHPAVWEEASQSHACVTSLTVEFSGIHSNVIKSFSRYDRFARVSARFWGALAGFSANFLCCLNSSLVGQQLFVLCLKCTWKGAVQIKMHCLTLSGTFIYWFEYFFSDSVFWSDMYS